MSTHTKCRRCGAPIELAFDIERNRWVPLDREPVARGLFVVHRSRVALASQAPEDWPTNVLPRRVKHTVTCTRAKKERRT